MNKIISFLAEILQKVKPVETRSIDNVKLKELDSAHLEAKGEINFEAKMGLMNKNIKYVYRYEIERLD